mmetsp:Transcript_62524/g.101131  ORF Transcript_62524/g.101131 Transcript_62524/m.101131 type:complete len:107 (-) Transcript_62524:442-762(-)
MDQMWVELRVVYIFCLEKRQEWCGGKGRSAASSVLQKIVIPRQLKKRSIFSRPHYTLEHPQFCLSENKIAGKDTQIAGAKSDKLRLEPLRDIFSPEESSRREVRAT